MKNTIKVEHGKCLLVMDKTFAKLSANVRSPEYTILQNARRDYPDYAVVTRQIRKNPQKETYAGLTYQYMEDYIVTHEAEEDLIAVQAEYHELKLISRCHAQASRYPTIKKWFLEKYPEITQFGIAA